MQVLIGQPALHLRGRARLHRVQGRVRARGMMAAVGFLIIVATLFEAGRRMHDPKLGGVSWNEQLMLAGTFYLGLGLWVAGIARAL